MVLFKVVMLILLAIDQYFELCLFGVREKSIDFNSILTQLIWMLIIWLRVYINWSWS